MKKLKYALGAALLFSAGVANAIIVQGTFFLPADLDPILLTPTGPTLTGTFTTADTAGATTNILGVTSVAITAFDVIVPPAPGQALTVLDFFNGPDAILSGPGSSTVVGLSGMAATTVANVLYSLSLTVDVNNVAQGTFTSSGDGPTASFSGDQVIPEPSALALLGAGLVAFGFVRRRKAA